MVVSSETPFPFLDDVGPASGVLGVNLLEKILDDLLFVVAGGVFTQPSPFSSSYPLWMSSVTSPPSSTTSCGPSIGMVQRLVGAPPIFLERLAFPGEHRHAGFRNGGGGVILGGKDVAARPTDSGAEVHQGLDQDRGLDSHVEGAGDPDARQRLGGRVLLADGHEAGHLVLGDHDFFAAPVGQIHVGDFVVGCKGG